MTGLAVATRIAVRLQPSTVFLEYNAADKGCRRVRAVKLAKLHSSYNSKYLDKLTSKVIKGFPADIDDQSINRDQLKGLLAQLLLAVQQQGGNTSDQTSSGTQVDGSYPCQPEQPEQHNSAHLAQQGSKLGSQQDGSAAAGAVHIQVDATANLDPCASLRSTDNKDDSISRQQRHGQPASRGANSYATSTVTGMQQQQLPSNSARSQLQQPGATHSPAQYKSQFSPLSGHSDLLNAMSDDLESEFGILGGNYVSSMRQQQVTAAPSGYSSATVAPQPTAAAALNAANKAANSPAKAYDDEDEDGYLTIEADYLAADDIDLNKATDYELRLAKAEMDKQFRQHLLQPGQPGYMYDKQADFQPAAEPNEWDEDD